MGKPSETVLKSKVITYTVHLFINEFGKLHSIICLNAALNDCYFHFLCRLIWFYSQPTLNCLILQELLTLFLSPCSCELFQQPVEVHSLFLFITAKLPILPQATV